MQYAPTLSMVSMIRTYQELLAQETGAIRKSHGGRIRVALVYPNTYWVGMSNLGFQAVYYLLNQRPDTVCERAFLPEPQYCSSPINWGTTGPKQEREMLRTRTPLCSLESQTPLADFDIVAFSISFEGDYPNVLKILQLARISPDAGKRERPLVILGGVCVTANPEPLALLADACVLGEGEDVVGEIMDAYANARQERASRDELLQQLAQIDGVYIPRGGTGATTRRWVKDLDKWPTVSRVLTPNTEFDMYLVELSRGCLHHCDFCLVSRIYSPCRFRSLEAIQKSVDEGLALGKTIGLVGAAVSDYPWMDRLSQYIIQRGGKFSVASLRADSLSPALLEGLAQSGHKTLALAPEAGSERLRRLIHKGLTEEQILAAAQAIQAQGIPNIRLYFMIGLPTEESRDIEAIIALARKASQIMRAANPRSQLTLSVSCFVPKPHTPLQWREMDTVNNLKAKIKYIRQQLEGYAKVAADSPRSAHQQAAFSLGDRRIGERFLKQA